MIGSLITSQTRIKLLKKFFLNSKTRAHLRGLESEFGESTNAIRVELNRLEKAGLLTSNKESNRKVFQANSAHPLYRDIHNIILKETGIDRVIEKVISKLGDLQSVYLTGDFARGREGKVIELILVGDNIDREYLDRKVSQAVEMVGRGVDCRILKPEDAEGILGTLKASELLLLWNHTQAV